MDINPSSNSIVTENAQTASAGNEQAESVVEFDTSYSVRNVLYVLIAPIFFFIYFVTQGELLLSLTIATGALGIGFAISYYNYFFNKRIKYRFSKAGLEISYGIGIKVNEHYDWSQFDRFDQKEYLSSKLFAMNRGKISLYRLQQQNAADNALNAIGGFFAQQTLNKQSGNTSTQNMGDLIGQTVVAASEGAEQDFMHEANTVTASVGSSKVEDGSFIGRFFGSVWGKGSKKYIHPFRTYTIGNQNQTVIDYNAVFINEMPNFKENLLLITDLVGQEKNLNIV